MRAPPRVVARGARFGSRSVRSGSPLRLVLARTSMPSMARWNILVLPCAVVACGTSPVEVTIPTELVAGAKSVLIALENDETVFQVGVAAPSSDRLTQILPVLEEYRGERLLLSVARSDRSLDELTLDSGVVSSVHPESGASRPILSLFRTPPGTGELDLRSVRVEGPELGDWEPRQPSEKLAAFAVPKHTLCAAPNTRVVNGLSSRDVIIRGMDFTSEDRVTWGGGLLVHTSSIWVSGAGVTGELSLEGDELVISEARPASGSKSFQLTAGNRHAFIAHDASGQFFVLDLEGRVRSVIPTPFHDVFDVEIGVDDSMFAVARKAGQVFELVDGSAVAQPAAGFPANVRALSVLDRGRMIAYVGDTKAQGFVNGELMLYEDGEWVRSLVEESEVLSPYVLAFEGGFAALMNADVLLHDGRSWQRFTGAELSSETVRKNGVAPLGGGRFLVVGDVGVAKIFDPNQGWCDISVGSHRRLDNLCYDRVLRRRAVASEGAIYRAEGPDIVALEQGSSITWFEFFLD